jgi:hypothetical protein
MTNTATAQSTNNGATIAISINGAIIATIKDTPNIVANIDKAIKRAGFIRTTGMRPAADKALTFSVAQPV